MENATKFLIKINDFGKSNLDKLKRYLYNTVSLYHLNQYNDVRLDGESKSLDIENLREFTSSYEADITIIYYNLVKGYAKKADIKCGTVTSNKSILFSEEIESNLMDGIKVGIKDFMFETLKTILDLSNDDSLSSCANDSTILN